MDLENAFDGDPRAFSARCFMDIRFLWTEFLGAARDWWASGLGTTGSVLFADDSPVSFFKPGLSTF